MKKLVKQSQETRYQWEDNVCIGKCTELIEQYDYDSEEEKNNIWFVWRKMDGRILGKLKG